MTIISERPIGRVAPLDWAVGEHQREQPALIGGNMIVCLVPGAAVTQEHVCDEVQRTMTRGGTRWASADSLQFAREAAVTQLAGMTPYLDRAKQITAQWEFLQELAPPHQRMMELVAVAISRARLEEITSADRAELFLKHRIAWGALAESAYVQRLIFSADVDMRSSQYFPGIRRGLKDLILTIARDNRVDRQLVDERLRRHVLAEERYRYRDADGEAVWELLAALPFVVHGKKSGVLQLDDYFRTPHRTVVAYQEGMASTRHEQNRPPKKALPRVEAVSTSRLRCQTEALERTQQRLRTEPPRDLSLGDGIQVRVFPSVTGDQLMDLLTGVAPLTFNADSPADRVLGTLADFLEAQGKGETHGHFPGWDMVLAESADLLAVGSEAEPWMKREIESALLQLLGGIQGPVPVEAATYSLIQGDLFSRGPYTYSYVFSQLKGSAEQRLADLAAVSPQCHRRPDGTAALAVSSRFSSGRILRFDPSESRLLLYDDRREQDVASITIAPREDDAMQKIVGVGVTDFSRLNDPTVVVPVLCWKKVEGKRVPVWDVPVQKIQERVGGAPISQLLGGCSAVARQGEALPLWWKHPELNGSGRTQKMREAQVVIFPRWFEEAVSLSL